LFRKRKTRGYLREKAANPPEQNGQWSMTKSQKLFASLQTKGTERWRQFVQKWFCNQNNLEPNPWTAEGKEETLYQYFGNVSSYTFFYGTWNIHVFQICCYRRCYVKNVCRLIVYL